MSFFRRRPTAHCPMCDTGHHHIYHVTGCTCCTPSSIVTTAPAPLSASNPLGRPERPQPVGPGRAGAVVGADDGSTNTADARGAIPGRRLNPERN